MRARLYIHDRGTFKLVKRMIVPDDATELFYSTLDKSLVPIEETESLEELVPKARNFNFRLQAIDTITAEAIYVYNKNKNV